MATRDEAIDALTEATAKMAELALKATAAASTAEKFASAARQLAEARAWVISPGQPHGGTVDVTVSK